ARGGLARRALPRAQGPRRPRLGRRHAELARARPGAHAALPHCRLAPRHADRRELRARGHQPHPAADPAAEGARRRADPAARRPGRPRAPRPARARLRPRRRRDLAAAVRRAGRRARVPALAPAAKGHADGLPERGDPGRRMARERRALRRPRGGERIPAPWPSARVAVAAAATATTIALVLYPVLAAERLGDLAVLAGVVAALVL